MATEPSLEIRPEPGFLEGGSGPLFIMYYSPSPAIPPRGSILYIHPFAEELNKSRRMAALQSRRFAAAGFGVLQPDLYGCGDSGGEFAAARWALWQTDLRRCLDWLLARSRTPLHIWGLRLGCLLAAELARQVQATGLILWHPVVSGATALTQFLRLRLATGILGGTQETPAQLRAELTAGRVVEVAGYELHPELAAALEQVRLVAPPAGTRVNWFELAATSERGLAPSTQRLLAQWRDAGAAISARTVVGEPFWSTQEITGVPALLEATSRSLDE
ncbi:MAG: hydrolase 2, exosortase A system-associated [Candidatus Competibacteraceae bacterium]